MNETYYLMNNQVKIPKIGFGTSLIVGQECIDNIKNAFNAGYRHIDTASAYKNEKEIGQALRESNIPREECFITSKVWKDSMGYENTIKSFNKTLEDLKLEYIDLFLIHWPNNSDKKINIDTWRALEYLYRQGKVKSIGLSNFLKHHIKWILDKAEIKPMVDQIEYHPGLTRPETVEFCKKNNILVEAWAPLGKGKMLTNPELTEIANKYNKSVAQLCIRWCVQNEILPLPKSSNIERMKQNLDIFDFTISKEDMEFIDNMEFFAGSDMDPNKS